MQSNNDDVLAAALTGQPPDVEVFDFSGMNTTQKETKTQFPAYPDPDGTIAILVNDYLQREALIVGLESMKGQFRDLVKLFHFQQNCGKHEIANAVVLKGTECREVLVQFKDSYAQLKSMKALSAILGPEMCKDYFVQQFTIKIDSKKIPRAKLQAVINDLKAVATKHGLGDALSVTPFFGPTEHWHADRYAKLTPEQNEQIENLSIKKETPGFMTVAVTTAKGRQS